MIQILSTSFRLSIFTIILTGFLYPYFITGVSSVLFPHKAKGSLIYNDKGNIIGSELIGQNFNKQAYFFPRPSSAGKGYDGLASGGSNEAPTSKKFLDRVREKIIELKKKNDEKIPIDLVTSSGSGLDPHISPQAAYWQAPKIALARDVSLKRVISLITDHIEYPHLGFLGNPRINVLKLNITLDEFFGTPDTTP